MSRSVSSREVRLRDQLHFAGESRVHIEMSRGDGEKEVRRNI